MQQLELPIKLSVQFPTQCIYFIPALTTEFAGFIVNAFFKESLPCLWVDPNKSYQTIATISEAAQHPLYLQMELILISKGDIPKSKGYGINVKSNHSSCNKELVAMHYQNWD